MVQGELGDCYFLVALSSLAQEDGRIKRLFRTPETGVDGVYNVCFYVTGRWQEVQLNDLVPSAMGEYGPLPLFARCKNGPNTWPIILEKAWAVLHFNYSNIVNGTLEEAFHALTGAHTKTYDLSGPLDDSKLDKFWEGWKYQFNEKKYAYGCTAKSQVNNGLQENHSYSILGFYDESCPCLDGSVVNLRLIKLRNPWSHKEWSGKWNDKDECWTDALKKKLNHENKEDGIFFMEFKDFMSYFINIVECKVIDEVIIKSKTRPQYELSSCRLFTSPQRPTVLQFKIEKEGEGHHYFTVSQMSRRHFGQKESYQRSYCSLILVKLKSDKHGNTREGETRFEHYTHGHSNLQYLQVDKTLEKGTYVAYILSSWKSATCCVLGFSIYSPKQITIIEAINPSHFRHNFMREYFLARVHDIIKERPSRIIKSSDSGMTIQYFGECTSLGLGCLWLTNPNPFPVIVSLKFVDVKINSHAEFYPPLKDGSISLDIGSGRDDIIVYRMLDPNALPNISIKMSKADKMIDDDFCKNNGSLSLPAYLH